MYDRSIASGTGKGKGRTRPPLATLNTDTDIDQRRDLNDMQSRRWYRAPVPYFRTIPCLPAVLYVVPYLVRSYPVPPSISLPPYSGLVARLASCGAHAGRAKTTPQNTPKPEDTSPSSLPRPTPGFFPTAHAVPPIFWCLPLKFRPSPPRFASLGASTSVRSRPPACCLLRSLLRGSPIDPNLLGKV